MKIPFSLPVIDDEVIAEMHDTLTHTGWLTTGPKARALEDEIRQFTGGEAVLCVNSWTSGAMLMLRWLGVGPGDEVIIPAYTYSATALCAMNMGAKVVMVDEMRDKLSYKAYLSAKNYYLREHYKAAVISLQNCLKDYPGSKYREEIMYMLFVSKYQMAVNSVEDKKVERYNNAREEYYYFADEYPNSRYAADVKKMYEDIEAYLENYKFED